MSARRILLFNKPFNVLSQFTDREAAAHPHRETLARYIDIPHVRPAGRLDRDSEGLLVLTDDATLRHKLTHPSHDVSKCYWVQVEGEVSQAALADLSQGVALKDGLTRPAQAQREAEPAWLWERHPPVRFRKSVPTSWLSLTLREGRNRQVRRMCAAVGFPVLRLIRYRVGAWTLDGLAPGTWFQVA